MRKSIFAFLPLLAAIILLSCGTVYAEDQSYCDQYGHSWADWEVVTEASITSPGVQQRICYVCSMAESSEIPKAVPFAYFDKKTATVYVGKTGTLKIRFANGDKIRKWKVSKKGIVKINKKGKVKGLRKGTVKVTVTLASGLKASCKVKVLPKKKAASAKKAAASARSSSGGSSGGTVYWTPNGEVYHSTSGCRSLARSRTINSGPLSSCPKSRPCKICY